MENHSVQLKAKNTYIESLEKMLLHVGDDKIKQKILEHKGDMPMGGKKICRPEK